MIEVDARDKTHQKLNWKVEIEVLPRDIIHKPLAPVPHHPSSQCMMIQEKDNPSSDDDPFGILLCFMP